MEFAIASENTALYRVGEFLSNRANICVSITTKYGSQQSVKHPMMSKTTCNYIWILVGCWTIWTEVSVLGTFRYKTVDFTQRNDLQYQAVYNNTIGIELTVLWVIWSFGNTTKKLNRNNVNVNLSFEAVFITNKKQDCRQILNVNTAFRKNLRDFFSLVNLGMLLTFLEHMTIRWKLTFSF